MNGEPHVTYVHGRNSLEWGDPERAILELDYIRADRGDITAEVSATSTVPTGGLVHVARVNLLSTRSLSEYAGHVARRAPETSTDWQRLLSVAAVETVARYRRGEPAVLLRDIAPAEDGGQILPPFALARMPTVLYGDGGASKSMVALATAASITSGVPYLGLEPSSVVPVGYLDWEMDGHEHRSRLGRLCGDDLPASSTSRAPVLWPTTSTGSGARSSAMASAISSSTRSPWHATDHPRRPRSRSGSSAPFASSGSGRCLSPTSIDRATPTDHSAPRSGTTARG